MIEVESTPPLAGFPGSFRHHSIYLSPEHFKVLENGPWNLQGYVALLCTGEVVFVSDERGI